MKIPSRSIFLLLNNGLMADIMYLYINISVLEIKKIPDRS